MKTILRTMTLAASISLAAVSAVHVQPARAQIPQNIAIVNSSFEADVLQDGFWIDGFLTGWRVFGFTAGPQNWTDAQYPGANDFDAVPSTVPDGRNSAFIRSPLAGIEQVLNATLQPNTEYRLDFFVGDRFDTIMPNYSADLFAGTTELAFNDTGVRPAKGQWLPASLTYTTGPSHPQLGQPLAIRFFTYGFTDPPGRPGLYQVGIDNVRLTATQIPEPGTLLLACIGAAVAHTCLKRRRIQQHVAESLRDSKSRLGETRPRVGQVQATTPPLTSSPSNTIDNSRPEDRPCADFRRCIDGSAQTVLDFAPDGQTARPVRTRRADRAPHESVDLYSASTTCIAK